MIAIFLGSPVTWEEIKMKSLRDRYYVFGIRYHKTNNKQTNQQNQVDCLQMLFFLYVPLSSIPQSPP